MSVTIDTSMGLRDLQAETLPLPESHPDSPCNRDEAATNALTTCIQARLIQSVTVQAPEADDDACAGAVEDVKYDADSALNSHKSIGSSSSSKSAAFAVAHDENVEKIVVDDNKFDTEESESVKDLETATSVDDNKTNQVNTTSPDTEPKIEVHATEKDATASDSSDQVVASPEVKLMDPNDTENNGDIARTFFTSELGGSLSPVYEQGRINLKFSEMTDLFIKATDTNGRVFVFQVYSATLEAASTVFYDMIYTSNTRGNKEMWLWELNDSVIGLKVMFSLLHLNYRAALFTRDPDSRQVYEVLRVLDKYGIRDEAFHPFVKSWIAGFRKGLDDTLLTTLERLYAAHKLGDFKTLKVCIRKIAHDIELSEDGAVLLDKKPIQEVVPISDELVANVQAVRAADLKNILQPLKTAYETLMGEANDPDPTRFCRSTDGHDECNEKLLGSLLGNLRRQKLRPIPTPSTYLGSVGALAEKVSQMDICGLIVPNLEPHKQRHGRCKLGQDDIAKQLLECKAYVPIYDDLIEQMVATTKRVGINKTEMDEFEDYMDVFNKVSIRYDEEVLHDFWGWEEDANPSDCVSILPTNESGVDGESDVNQRKASVDLTVPVDSAH